MNTPRRVVITGLGIAAPLALTSEGLWDALSSGASGVRPLEPQIAEALPIRFAAPVFEGSCDIESFGSLDAAQKKAIRKGFKVMSREILLAVAATQRALSDAGIAFGQISPRRIGVSFGCDHIMTVPEELLAGVRTCMTPRDELRGDGKRFDFTRWAQEGLPTMTPLWQLKYLPNMPASHIAIYNDFQGPNNSMTLREASIGAVLGESVHHIRKGRVDAMLIGTTGTRLHPYKMVHAIQQEELAPRDSEPEEACRPFDKDRRGTVLGEGAGALVLESEEHARARGATILAEVVAGTYSSTFDPKGTDRRGETLIRVLRKLFDLTGCTPDDVGHINAHGLGSVSADHAEAGAIAEVFANRTEAVPVTAAKGYFGNLGAGSGAVEFVASVVALQKGRLFPTRNNRTDDPACPIRVVRDAETPAGDSFVKLAFNPQGQASAVLVRRV